MKIATLEDLLVEQLKDIYSAEMQLKKALPRMAKAATSEELQEAFTSHLEETEAQIERLDRIFNMLDIKPGRKKCKAMEGLIEEGSEAISEDVEPMVRDAALIAAAQRVEHYEIAAYGCVRTFATIIGKAQIAKILQKSLDEEAAADVKLTDIAMNGINQEAAEEELAGSR